MRIFFVAVPLALGAFAGWDLLTSSNLESIKLFVAASAFGAGLLPSIHAALGLDESIGECGRLAGEFKNLQDNFRQAALIESKKPYPEFEGNTKLIMQRLEESRRVSVTPPEWCFRLAQKKIKKGDYTFDVDLIEG
jgi:hypothetical protein